MNQPKAVDDLRPRGEVHHLDPARSPTEASATVDAGSDREQDTTTSNESIDTATAETDRVNLLQQRIEKVERYNRWMRHGILFLAIIGTYSFADRFLLDQVVVKQRLMESRELKLVDAEGNARLFVRMYSRVPVLQIMDSNGKPRMSIGLRFDDTPFIDLSDKAGRTRATFEMTEDDTPALRLLDERGRTSFHIN